LPQWCGHIPEPQGHINQLSESHHHWEAIDAVAQAAVCDGIYRFDGPAKHRAASTDHGDIAARKIIRGRRSAAAMDGTTSIDATTFMRMMRATLPGCCPFDALPWLPRVHLAVFVHRVDGLTPGVYMLVRNGDIESLQAACRDDFAWRQVDDDLPLYMLTEGDGREAAKTISCQQDIASDGAFAVGMIAHFREPLEQYGPWFYPRLFWETGAIGQVLYLEAEAAGVRGTGIGCFFDDLMHQVLGIEDLRFQSLYHFTVGGPVEDTRLRTIPAYAHLDR
jgi:nitroreductase